MDEEARFVRSGIYEQLKIFGIMVLIGFIIILIIALFNKPQDEVNLIDNKLPESVRNIVSQQIKWNNVPLYDSTVFDNDTNTCTAYRYGMNITISPCIAYDIDGKDIRQDVNFIWNGANQKNISWIFVYDGVLESGGIDALVNTSYDSSRIQNTWVSNYLIDKIVSYTNLTQTPTRCDLGNLNNTQFYNVARTTNNATTYNQTICFTSRSIVNATSFRISGNADLSVPMTAYRMDWRDVSNKIQYLGKGLLEDNRSYYKIEDVTFNPNQEIKTQWKFTPKDNIKRGKWHILGYETETGLVNSIINNQYIYIDPWWSSSWGYKQAITVSGTVVSNQSIKLVVNKSVNMKADYSDLRFINGSENTELYYWIANYTTTNATVYVKLLSNNTFYMYYGNAGASTTSDKRNLETISDVQHFSTSGWGTLDSATKTGQRGRVNATVDITFIRKTATTTATIGYISDSSKTTLQSGSFNGDYYNLSIPYRLERNIDMIFMLDKSGASFTWNYTGLGYNGISYNDTFIEWKWGLETAGNNYAGITGVHSVGGIYVANTTNTFGSESASASISISLSSPATSYLSSSSNVTMNFMIYPNSINVTNWTLYVWYSNSTLRHSHFSGVLNTNNSVNDTHSDQLYPDGDYIWNVQGCGISGGVVYCGFDTNRTFSVHTTSPTFTLLNTISNITTISLPVSANVNVTTTDPYLSVCKYWTTNNATNQTYTCNTTQTIYFTSGGSHDITFWANDTFGNSNLTSYNFRIYDFNVSSYENADPIAEGSTSNIYLKINSTSFPIGDASAIITWNNTGYSATSKDVLDTNTILFTYSFPLVAGLGNATGITYYYNWTYNTTQLSTRTTPTGSQTVISFGIDNCAVYGVQIANFSLKDEETNSNLFSTTIGTNFEIEALITSANNPNVTWSYYQTFTNLTSIALCVPAGVLNSSNFTIDMTIGFDGTNHVREFWYLDNGTLAKGQYPFNSYTSVNQSMMDLTTTDSTTFLFEYTDTDGLKVDGTIIHVFRKYIGEGLFREVERARQDNNGQTHVHLVEEDVIYYFMVTKDGRIIYTSDTYNAKCLASPCTITLSSSTTNTDWNLYDNDGGKYGVSTNKNTRVVTTQFQLDSISLVNVSLYEINNSGDANLITMSSLTATSGTIPLTVPLSYGNKSYFIAIYKDNQHIKSEWVDLTENGRDYFGTSGAIFGGLIVLAIMLMAVSEGLGFIVFTGLAIVIIGMMQLVDLTWYSIISIICAGAIIIFKLIKRRQQA